MNSSERNVIDQIVETFDSILHGKKPELIEEGEYSESINSLVKIINEFILSFYEIWDFILPLSNGILNVEPPKSRNVIAFPFKELHSQLRNLVWQVQQVAKGDYNQKVYFMGEFAEAFNKMVDALKEKQQEEIAHRRRLEENIYYLENYDPLTKVPNRNALEKKFEEFFPGNIESIKGALLLLDVDNMKFLNESFDHTIGDMVLINLASLLKESIKGTYFLTRLGGDKFLVLLKDLSGDEAVTLAEALRRAVEKERFCPVNFKYEIGYTVSIGIVSFCDRKLNLNELISIADYALHMAKEEGRNSIYLISEEIATIKNNEINSLLLAVRKAIELENLTLYFQPIVDVDSGRVVHHEALMRIKSENEIIYPDKILSVAQRFGLILQIDRLVVKQSFRALAKYPELCLFVNLSGTSVGDDEMLEFIIENLKEYNIEPSRVGFEITETMAIKNFSKADKWIRKLKEIGCRFALDDFGIGFSTFSYLQYLSVDYVKIDGSYVCDLDKNSKNRALVQAINTVAVSLGKQVIAEHVENNSVLDILQDDGIGFAQGYYFGKPEEVPRF